MRRYHLIFLLVGLFVFLWWARSPPRYRWLTAYPLAAKAIAAESPSLAPEMVPLINQSLEEAAKAGVADRVVVVADSADRGTQTALAPFLPDSTLPLPVAGLQFSLRRTGRFYAGFFARAGLQAYLRSINANVLLPPRAIVVMAGGMADVFVPE